MQILAKRNIKTLADLTDPAIFDILCELLLSAWENVLFCDPAIEPSELPISVKDQELLRDGCNRDFWSRLHNSNKSAFYKKRAHFRKLVSKYSKINVQAHGRNLIVNELAEIRGKGPILPCAESGHFNTERTDFTTWIKSHFDPIPPEDLSTCPTQDSINKSTEDAGIKGLHQDQTHRQEHPHNPATEDAMIKSLHQYQSNSHNHNQPHNPATEDAMIKSLHQDQTHRQDHNQPHRQDHNQPHNHATEALPGQAISHPTILKDVNKHANPAKDTRMPSGINIIKGILLNDTALIHATLSRLADLITNCIMRSAK